jgi:hypothetical protein
MTPTRTSPSSLQFHHDATAKTLSVSGSLTSELSLPVGLDHVRRLCDGTGILEHAEGSIGRREHGYCTDDISRQLLVATFYQRERNSREIAEQALGFLRHASLGFGPFFRSRMNYARLWMDDGASEDASGRALWCLGSAASVAPWPNVRRGALLLFDRACAFRSIHWHATAFATLGARAVLDRYPNDAGANELLSSAARSLPKTPRETSWRWHESHITYASAILPDALLALSCCDASRAEEGLMLLRWLAEVFVQNGRFSAVPTNGLCAADERPGFDQQPIEAQAFASAAWRAWLLTKDTYWLEQVVLAASWFVGHNDSSIALVDRETNGCFDGLQQSGRNENQGAESTLAMLHVMAILDQAVAAGAVFLYSDSEPECATSSDHD